MKIIVDTREQAPLRFDRWPEVSTVVKALAAGDYSLAGLEAQFAVERKSVADLVSSVTIGRDRLIREMERFRGYAVAAIVVEGTLEAVARHQYRSKANPDSVLQTLASWQVKYGVPTIWAGSPEGCAYMVRALARHYLRTAEQTAQAILRAHGEAEQEAVNA